MSNLQRIFLGHASEDKPRVRKLYHQLRKEGFSPWLDVEDLIPGQNWQVEIPNAIKNAAIFLACLSMTSVAKRGYVQREFRYALTAYAELPPYSIYLIPVRLDDCEVPDLRLPELEISLRSLHWVNLFEPDGFERLAEAIRLNVMSERSVGADPPAFSEGRTNDPAEKSAANVRHQTSKKPARKLKAIPVPSNPHPNPIEVLTESEASWTPDPRLAAVKSLYEEQSCAQCGSQIAIGEPAIKQTWRKPGSKGKSFTYYHRRCTPKKEAKASGDTDIYDRRRRAQGSFGSGKRT